MYLTAAPDGDNRSSGGRVTVTWATADPVSGYAQLTRGLQQRYPRDFSHHGDRSMTRQAWRPIEDIPADWQKWTDDGLSNLRDEWEETRKRLVSADSEREFLNRLKRKWAIETGIIEGLYDLDRGITKTLIERGLDTNLTLHASVLGRDSDLVGALIRDQAAALDFVFDFVKGNRPLSTAFIRELHALLTRNQRTVRAADPFGRLVEVELRRGDWKVLPNNPTTPDGELHEYCPPEQVASEMNRLVEMHAEHLRLAVPEVIEAAWLHHRFAQIHPFQDGNGRVARALASMVFIRGGYFPLVVERDDRTRYLDALERADDGDLSDLIRLFSQIQQRALLPAISLAEEVAKAPATRAEAIRRATAPSQEIAEAVQQAQERLVEIAKRLQDIAFQTLQGDKQQIEEALPPMQGLDEVAIEESTLDKEHFFQYQIVEAAKKLGYFANMRGPRLWVRLRLPTLAARNFNIVLSFHLVGPRASLVMACSAITFRLVQGDPDAGGSQAVDIAPATDPVFQFTVREPVDSIERRFREWLDAALTAAFSRWRL